MIPQRAATDLYDGGRREAGQRAGAIGIAVNALLFAVKLAAGMLGNSVSILADGFNNLGDCACSLVTVLGFRFSGKATDEKHPYGYGRMEYICGFIVSMLIILTALSVGKASVARIIHLQTLSVSPWIIAAQVSAIAVKLALALYFRKVNRTIRSAALRAAFADSLADAAVTAATLLPLFMAHWTPLPIDGIAGLILAGAILWAGLGSFIEHLDLLLGKAVGAELTEGIAEAVRRTGVLSGIKALHLYDYGPDNQVIFLQVVPKVNPHTTAFRHAMEALTATLKREYRLDATVYWDADHQSDINGKEYIDGHGYRLQRELPQSHSSD